MWLRTLLTMLVLAATALAGCSDSGSEVDEEEFEDLGLEATEDTGVIRGVVVDASVTPIADAQVEVVGQDLVAQTGENGAFGFQGVAPGDHFIQVSKPGFLMSQQSVLVEAGVAQPPVVKVLLEPDPEALPYVEVLQFDGFIECSVSAIAAGVAVCSVAESDNDVFIEEYRLEGAPEFSQSEAVWESTQALGDRMSLLYSAPGDSTLLDNYGEDEGTSPLLVQANRTTLEHYNVGQGQTLMVRVFNAPVEGTRPPDPVNGDDCFDRPALGGCLTGVGATLNQAFTVYTHNFYNMLPEEDWRFTDDGAPELP